MYLVSWTYQFLIPFSLLYFHCHGQTNTHSCHFNLVEQDDQEGVRTVDDENFIDDTGVDPADRYGSDNERHSPGRYAQVFVLDCSGALEPFLLHSSWRQIIMHAESNVQTSYQCAWTLNLFLSGFISSLPQLAWEKRLCCCCCLLFAESNVHWHIAS